MVTEEQSRAFVGKTVEKRGGPTEAEIQAQRLSVVGDAKYSPVSARERLTRLGYIESMWPAIENRLGHELRALIRIARGNAPRLLRDVLPEVNAEEKIGRADGDSIKYFQQVLEDNSRYDGWEKQVETSRETLIRGVLFKDRTFIWTSEAGHSAMSLAANLGDKLPVIDVTVFTHISEADQTSIGLRVFPGITDGDIDLIAGYFRRSMNDSPKVVLSVTRPKDNFREFTGTFAQYFAEKS
nr:hypothetical protein [Candidatus Levybacteria bacterium]